MATEVGTGYVTIYSKMSPDFDKPIQSSVKASGKTSGSNFGDTFSVAAGNLLSKGIEKALSVVTAHMDSAIGRVDALNQFPKVMQNIGFSSEEAQAAISKMSDGINGLPTTLDEIVGNTQRLAMSIGDLDTATDVALALNDGFLMFGASSAEVSGAITQLNQMITAGKYDMQSWNSINQAAPGFLDSVARAMLGAEGDAGKLRDALNNGQIKTEDFLGAIVKLDKEGSGDMASFQNGVKSATGGIATSMSRVDSAITRNLANLLDLGAETVGFGNICDVAVEIINLVGNTIGGWLKDAIKICAPYVKDLKDSVKRLGETASPLIPIIKDCAKALGTTLHAAIVLVIAIFNVIVNTVINVINFFKNLGSTVSTIASNMRNAISNFVTNADNAFNNFTTFVKNAISKVVSGVSSFVTNVANAARNIANNIINALSSLPSKAWEWGTGVVSNIADGIWNLIGNVTNAASDIWNEISSWIGDLPSKAWTWGSDMVSNLVDGMRSIPVVGAAMDIADSISSYLHFSEPDVGPLSNFHTFMPDMMHLMAKGIRDNIGLVRREVDNLSWVVADGVNLNPYVNANGTATNSEVVNAINTLHGDLYGIIKDASPAGLTGRQFGRLVNRYA